MSKVALVGKFSQGVGIGGVPHKNSGMCFRGYVPFSSRIESMSRKNSNTYFKKYVPLAALSFLSCIPGETILTKSIITATVRDAMEHLLALLLFSNIVTTIPASPYSSSRKWMPSATLTSTTFFTTKEYKSYCSLVVKPPAASKKQLKVLWRMASP